ncbi:MAG: hypothetical protein M3256_27875 [Actinomycetota bacterium]|nr:hypothetical protein [Actinomycetota bacterium]
MGPACLPCYLLLLAGPAKISWAVQAWLARMPACVGRIDPEMPGCDTYLHAVAEGWPESGTSAEAALVWSVAQDEMGQTMRRALADPITVGLRQRGCQVHVIDDRAGAPATEAALVEALAAHPGLVVTTSHGSLGKAGTMLEDVLGLPIDGNGGPVEVGAVVEASSAGAIWVIHACCSAGSARPSELGPLFCAGTSLRSQLDAVEASAPLVAPLPSALLGAARPVRAVVAQVELTFDWMLVDAMDGELRSAGLVDGAISVIGDTRRVGHALMDHWLEAGGFERTYSMAYDRYIDGAEDEFGLLFRAVLGARNREATVILGDPTVGFLS